VLDVPAWLWIVFAASVIVMLIIDLLAHRNAHVIGFREAAWWSAGWVGVSLVFAGVVWASLGTGAAVEFTTAWLLEKSLSVDNLFVFALIFGYFAVPKQYQHRALFYGVIGALLFRAIFIGAGVAIVSTFTAVLFVFAAILLWSAYKLLRDNEEDYDPSRNIAVRLSRPASGSPRPCSWSWSPSRRQTSSSPWIAFRPCWPSATSRSSCTRPMRSRSSAYGPCTSSSPECWTASTTCRRGWRSSSASSASS
jgi:hypothetical protein